MNLELKGKIAFVAGASQGMGAAVAQCLSEEGATVIVCARNKQKLEQKVQEIESKTGNKVVALACDVSREEEVKAVFNTIKEQFKTLDLLFTNSGAPAAGSLATLTTQNWNDAFQTIVMSVRHLCFYALPLIHSGGAIVINTSSYIRQPSVDYTLASNLRMATAGMVKTMADELAAKGIRVNGIAPGYTNTEVVTNYVTMVAKQQGKTFEQMEKEMTASIPLNRFAAPEEIGKVVAFLLSSAASFVHGSIWTIDGGESRFPI